jgi:hypothetical protein
MSKKHWRRIAEVGSPLAAAARHEEGHRCPRLAYARALGKRRKSRWSMTEAEALERDPGALKVPGTEEVRWLPEAQQERDEALFKR